MLAGYGSERCGVGTGSALLDSGAGIATASLRRHGSELTWKHGGRRRRARLE
jgi:hypothetical protein